MTAYLISHFIDEAAHKAPGHEAIRFGDSGLTYQQLSEKSNALAHALRDSGVRRGDRVAIYMNKGIEPAISIYGTMKSGGVYVPLNAAAPESRLRELIRDCGIRHLITQPQLAERLRRVLADTDGVRFVFGLENEALPKSTVGMSWNDVWQNRHDAVDAGTIGLDAAYMIYTSGSTGVSKGIVHTHRGAIAFAQWAHSAYGLGPSDRFANHAPLHFDMSTFDYFVSAASGATTVVIPESHMLLPASYSQLLQDQCVSVLFVVPFALVQLLTRGALQDRDLSSLRWIIFGGDTSSPKHIRELMLLLPGTRFGHMYGPAETNGCTYFNLPGPPLDDDVAIPIGSMCEGMEGLIVNGDEIVEDGEAGELLVRTPTLMQGYWQQPETTENALFRRRVGGVERVYYRTGDLVRKNEAGQLIFLGRNDRQVKVRGYRVEMDEVEVILTSNQHVEEAAVYSLLNDTGTHQLCASVILRANSPLEASEVANFLRDRLPPYAIPEHIDIVAQLPRTTSGKIDRRALSQRTTS